MYKLQNDLSGKLANCVVRLSDNACIPFDPENSDYQAYLKYQAEGGVVLPADEQGELS